VVCTRILALAAVCLAGCGSALDITPKALPNGAVGLTYHQALSSTGQTPIRWQVAEGSLPSGLELGDATGILEGTPSQPGSFAFTLQSTEAGTFHSNDGFQSYTLTVLPKLVPDATVAAAQAGQDYAHTLGASGGVPPYQIVVKGLPAHFSYDAETATITGAPTFPGSYTLEVDVTDSGNPEQAAASFPKLVIKPLRVSIATSGLPTAQLGSAYSFVLQTRDGLGPFRWRISDGALPAGLELGLDSGAISGTPNARGDSSFTVEVDDLGSPPDAATRNFTLGVR